MIDKINVEIGQKIHRARVERKLTQDDLASLCELKRVSISLIEKGKQKISIDRLLLMAFNLNIPIQNLLPTREELSEIFKINSFDSVTSMKYDDKELSDIDKFINKHRK